MSEGRDPRLSPPEEDPHELTKNQLVSDLTSRGVDANLRLTKAELVDLYDEHVVKPWQKGQRKQKSKAPSLGNRGVESERHPAKTRRRRKAEPARIITFLREHYQNYCLIVLAILGLLKVFAGGQYDKFWSMQYRVEPKEESKVVLYDTGWDDMYLVATLVFALTYLRYVYHNNVLRLYCKLVGITEEWTIVKFQEAGWFALYYPLSWAYGMYLLYLGPNPWSQGGFDCIWQDYPQIPMGLHEKIYLVVQLAMWIHCLFVIQIEEKRKDYVQMFSHHVVTIILVTGALLFGYVRAGTFFMTLMDTCDVLLYNLKLGSYIGGRVQKIANMGFIVFMLVWAFTRHFLYGWFLWSFFKESNERLWWETSVWGGLFIVLQLIVIYWFYLILKMAVGFVVTGGEDLSDVRSDDEGAPHVDDIKGSPVIARRKSKAE